MREKLSSRRESPAICFMYGPRENQQEYRVGLGLRPNGECAEIFLNGAKEGSDYQAVMGDLATMASLLMQHGYSAENLARRLSLDGLARAALTYAARMEREFHP